MTVYNVIFYINIHKTYCLTKCKIFLKYASHKMSNIVNCDKFLLDLYYLMHKIWILTSELYPTPVTKSMN